MSVHCNESLLHAHLDHLWLEDLFQQLHHLFEFIMESDFVLCLVTCYPNLYGDREWTLRNPIHFVMGLSSIFEHVTLTRIVRGEIWSVRSL
jgi:hypothetical protein